MRGKAICLFAVYAWLSGPWADRSACADSRRSATAPTAGACRDFQRLVKDLQSLANSQPSACKLESFGKSRGGKDLWALRIARPGTAPPENRAALLMVAGLDGEHLVGGETAIRVAERMLAASDGSDAARLLSEYAVYVIPRVNPDAQEAYFATPRDERMAALRPVDGDRDGKVDEDGPEDLNGDGLITLMRVKDPEATHLPDPMEPRLLREPDRAKGQRAIYRVYPEGIDNDGDEEYNEDPPGGVELNFNFPHGYAEHGAQAGPHALSEPESLALIQFVIGHPRTAAVITYGRHCNLIEAPKGDAKDATGEAPIELLKDDVAVYEAVGKRYRELAKVKKSPKSEWAGTFFAWAYAQYGIPSFATPVWFRPEVEDKKPTTEPAASQPASAPSSSPTVPSGAASDREKKDEDKPADEEAAAWLKYSDKVRDGEGFVPWASIKHPTLGEVEVGGFRPFFRSDPPADQLESLADREFAFAVDVLGRLPKLSIQTLSVKAAGDGVWELEIGIVNDGYFPTALAIGKANRRVRPLVVRLDVPPERMLGGPKLETVWSVPGSGGVHKIRWVVAGAGGSSVEVKVASEKYGDLRQSVKLETTKGMTP